MSTRENRWYRSRFTWVAVILLATAAVVVVLVGSNRSKADPADLQG